MTTKQLAIHAIEDLPDEASWDDIQERISFISGVRRALEDLDRGKGIPHERVKEEFSAWLTE